MSWTDERVETLKKLWLDGLSASQIAKKLGGISRNAAIGKLHRLGLAGRVTPAKPTRPAPMRPAKPAPIRDAKAPPVARAPHQNNGRNLKAAAAVSAADPNRADNINTPHFGKGTMPGVKPPTKPVHRLEEPGSATILTLCAHQCKWPIGDPAREDFTFCGKWREPGRAYCTRHIAIAYQPVPASGKRRSLESLTNIDRPRHRSAGAQSKRAMFE